MKHKYITKTKKHVVSMFKLWKFAYSVMTRSLVLALMIGINLYGFSAIGSTNAYYNDIETSNGNGHVATSLDFILTSTNWIPGDVLEPGDSVLRDITVVNDGNLDFKYTVRSEKTGGDNDFCNALDLDVLLEGVPYYSGSLIGFTSSQELFSISDEWIFNTSLAINETGFNGKACEFDFIFEGWQTDFASYPSGFNDEERVEDVLYSSAKQCNVVDFDRDANGDSILTGQVIDDEYAAWGLNISAVNYNGGHPDVAITFDSANPSGGDSDLGTPNEDFGGPGIGSGGELGESGENNQEQHNVLIIAEDIVDSNTDGYVDDPDDEAAGGKLIFTFDEPTWVNNLRIFDIEESNVKIKLYDDLDVNFSTINISALGNNSAETINIDTDGVKKMVVKFVHSGAVDDICFQQVQEEEHEPNYDIVLNEFLPNPDGFEYGFDFGTDAGLMPQGEWIEIYNNGSSAFNLDGWYTWDGSGDNSNKVYITALNTDLGTTIIGANSWLVVYMNKEILGNTDDTVKLYDDHDTLIDSYTYDLSGDCDLEPTVGDTNDETSSGTCNAEVPGNKSYARIPDGIGAFVDPIPTPGFVNKSEEEPQVESVSTGGGSSVVEVKEEVVEEPELEEVAVIEETYDLIEAVVSLVTLQNNEEQEIVEQPLEDIVTEESTDELIAQEEVVEESIDVVIETEEVVEEVLVEVEDEIVEVVETEQEPSLNEEEKEVIQIQEVEEVIVQEQEELPVETEQELTVDNQEEVIAVLETPVVVEKEVVEESPDEVIDNNEKTE